MQECAAQIRPWPSEHMAEGGSGTWLHAVCQKSQKESVKQYQRFSQITLCKRNAISIINPNTGLPGELCMSEGPSRPSVPHTTAAAVACMPQTFISAGNARQWPVTCAASDAAGQTTGIVQHQMWQGTTIDLHGLC